MRKVLRSLVWSNSTDKDQTTHNYKSVQLERLTNLSTSETKSLEFLLDFYQRKGEAPQFQLLHDQFETANDAEGIVLCEEIQVETAYYGGSFVDLFEREVEEQAVAVFVSKAKLAIKIAKDGAEVTRGVTVKGADEAVAFAFSELKGAPKLMQGGVPANMKDAGPALLDLYQQRKNNPQEAYGVMTGYGIFDSAWHGLKKKQLTFLAGFGGHLKSTLMVNIIVNSAVDGGYNQFLASSEMPADDLKMMMVAIHSGNPKFNGVHRPLSFNRYLAGALSAQEEQFMMTVQDDLLNNSQHGSIRVIDSGEFTSFGSIIQRVTRDHADEEVDSLWVDYITRLPLDAKYRGMEITHARNETIADAKRLAMQFDQGKGLPVNSPFQVNREGYKHAKANEGRMNKTALAQYNAAEKEADNIGYIFFDSEEEATSEPKVGLLKARWGAMKFDPVNVYIDPDSRRIYDMTAGVNAGTGAAPTAGGGVEDVEL